jgi:hypothetical protein
MVGSVGPIQNSHTNHIAEATGGDVGVETVPNTVKYTPANPADLEAAIKAFNQHNVPTGDGFTFKFESGGNKFLGYVGPTDNGKYELEILRLTKPNPNNILQQSFDETSVTPVILKNGKLQAAPEVTESINRTIEDLRKIKGEFLNQFRINAR